MRTRRLRMVVTALALVGGLALTGCGKESVKATVTTTTVAAPGAAAPTTVAPAGGSTSVQTLDQQIQGLTQSLSQVSTDLANADKAIANGG